MNLFKNLKVSTKLAAILVAPIVVLIVLAVVGVQQRRGDADEANRIEQLTEFAQTNAALVQQLQLESLRSGAYMASGGESGQAELEAQRAATDEAKAGFEASLDSVDPGSGEPDIAEAVEQAQNRLEGLSTIRNSVTNLQTNPLETAEQFSNTGDDLIRLNLEIAQAADQPELARGLQSFVNLSRVKAPTAYEATLLTILVQEGRYVRWTGPTAVAPCGSDAAGAQVTAPADDETCVLYTEINAQQDNLARASGVYEENTDADGLQIFRDADAGGDFNAIEARLFEAGQSPENTLETPSGPITTPEEWIPTAIAKIDSLRGAEDQLVGSVLSEASELASQAQNEAFLYGVFAAGAVLIAIIIAILVARATVGPLRRLTSAAYTLSTDKLPALVERLRNPEADEGESLAETLTPIDIDSRDEIGQLADAFNSIQQVTIEVAEEQSQLLRKGIGDIFINLARRNQTLLDRQIEFIDQLEANEEDPDQLDNLFKLDHLATRMRRNAESLLVLAGAEPPRRRGRPVALADVVRVAIGEVEDFARIQLLSLDEATVGGNVAVDLAHLLSELMENATHFSPPDTMVEIVGHRADAGYIISVSDQGIGMSADQLAEANAQLAKPPLVGLALSRSLGFIVIGRLASRFEIQVKLTSSPSGGVTALVTLPPDLVTFEGDEEPAPPAAAPADAPAAADEAAAEDVIVLEDEGELIDELFEESPLAESEDFERGLASLVSDDLPEAPVEPDVPTGSLVEDEEEAPAEPEPIVDEQPVVVDDEPEAPPEPSVVTPPEPVGAPQEAAPAPLTAAGLVQRTPKKRSEGAVGGGELNADRDKTSSGQSARSPEEIRKMLSRYRSGLNKGKQGADSEQSNS